MMSQDRHRGLHDDAIDQVQPRRPFDGDSLVVAGEELLKLKVNLLTRRLVDLCVLLGCACENQMTLHHESSIQVDPDADPVVSVGLIRNRFSGGADRCPFRPV